MDIDIEDKEWEALSHEQKNHQIYLRQKALLDQFLEKGAISQEQVNVFKMHGYTAAWIIPEGISPEGVEIKEQAAHKYAAIHIDRPFDNPFVTIPGAYYTLGDFMRTNGLRQAYEGVIPCFETDGESMDVYIACE